MPTDEGYNGAHTGVDIDSAISAVKQKQTTWDGKAEKPNSRQVILASGSWSNKMQTVSVTGVIADENTQMVRVTPLSTNRTAYDDAGIKCITQAANSLTFSCEDVPSSNITVYVIMETVNFQE